MANSTIPSQPRHSLTARLLTALGWLARILPVTATISLGRWLGRGVGLLCRRELRIAMAQVSFARLKDSSAAPLSPRSVALGAFSHVGESVAELFLFHKLLESPDADPDHPPDRYPTFPHIRATGSELCNAIVHEKKPCLAISGHLGNFELLAAYHAKCGLRVTVIGREPNYSELATFIDRLRTGYGAQSIWRHGRAAASIILRALRNGRSLAVLLDQDTALESAYAPFFSVDAASPRAPVDLAVRNKIRIVSTFIVRESVLQHHVITEEILYDPSAPNVVESIFATYNERLEALIRHYPKQWIWWHRRWRRRPGVDYTSHPERLPGTEGYLQWIENQENQQRFNSR